MTMADRHEAFARLHMQGCFVMPNPWDRGSARMMAASGAVALATTSAGHAFTLGRPDMGGVTRDEALAHAQDIVSATPLPVSGDFENGFGDDPDTVAETIRMAAEAGLSGCGIEDMGFEGGLRAYDFDLAVARIRAAVAAARALGRPFVLTARADGVMNGLYDLDEGIRRLQAYQAAGADCLYLPVPPGRAELARVLAAVSAPVNALSVGALQDVSLADLATMGVRRVSLGSQMARVTHAVIRDTMRHVLAGDFTPLKASASGAEVDAMLREGSAND
ncbi:isocitrate lyase/phosphoenolpyruvate mutase family protein [Rhodobacteraceae bacterium N5(2021)]|uniref:Isocitrate lyase/phosphoenolpyruvate mutase family protein n=1 Tax=Gymnodinialimonas phycosphaerae TaxID=2841589 RepID=A0A975TVE7_9RHOB|nr:isocitrate lyase/phosphoenolpyruvate mutase family protein [Gymnodinialimonas phycosphaerae]MBY4891422.1 isocitrate lyase/phosphoenolpyruvate mutase family protein [Gymnodinialimonas phycosphaerae]